MKSIVIYYSQTGNTETIATRISSDTSSDLKEVSTATVDEALTYDKIILGCPAMGDEELDPDFEDFYKSLIAKVNGQKVFIFGSYAWNDGEWLRKWNADVATYLGSEVPALAVFETDIDEGTYQDFIDAINA